MSKYVVAIDQGTTSSRTMIFDREGNIVSQAQKEFQQYFPQPGWVEHDPHEIWSSQASTIAQAMTNIGAEGKDVAAIGITNQRETTIVWDAETGQPIYNAIVWQDRRTADYCAQLERQGHTGLIRQRTGLLLDAYFSATKIRWMLDHVPGAREKAEAGRLRFGTIDTWLIWNMTNGERHVTDVTNASRTLLYNIHTLTWDETLLRLFDIPRSILPEVKSSSEVYGCTRMPIFALDVPIAGIAGDQQAALFGQMCTEPGSIKSTYGTGCFLLMNTGARAVLSENNLITTIAWKIGGEVCYALEGSVFVAGSVIKWLRDEMKMFRASRDIDLLAESVPDSGGVYFVPALTGLGAPYWDPYATGTITGITRGTRLEHIARAALEGIAFETMDIVEAMRKDAAIDLGDLKVDGGVSQSDVTMQFQADMLGTRVVRPTCVETTAKGAAYLAGLAVGFWTSIDEIKAQWAIDRVFTPSMPAEKVDATKAGWRVALGRAMTH
ncbi:MAG: glycerol kinase GlpK [Bacteroidaceae bacterium]|nr:glycerol kinase GlpK [Bacteroidaceae bacterium]